MSEIIINKIREDFYSMEFGAVRCFMFIGEDRVLLIDAGFPERGLIEKVRQVSDLPIEVIYSHCDGDHRGDVDLFDRPYLHPSEMDYLNMKHQKPLKLRAIWEGDTVNIGKYSFEVFLIPGHTPGSIALLEREERFMLTGDTVHNGPVHMFGPGRNLQAYLYSLYKLKGLSNAVDIYYTCHHKLEATSDTLDDLIKLTEQVLDGELDGVMETMKGREVKRYSYGQVSFYGE